MRARRQFRDREPVDVAILDALVDRTEEGMTVFELRSHVEADIDDIEAALSRLKEDGLIDVENSDGRTVILPDDRVVPDEPAEFDHQPSIVERVRERLPF
jgi:DNA-binding transcriptional ArsR family regulator